MKIIQIHTRPRPGNTGLTDLVGLGDDGTVYRYGMAFDDETRKHIWGWVTLVRSEDVVDGLSIV